MSNERYWKRDDARSHENYKHSHSQSFKENFSTNNSKEQRDCRRSCPTSTNKQENESFHYYQENDTKLNRRYTDRIKNQDRYQRFSLGFMKNKNKVPNRQGSTIEEISHSKSSTSNIKVKGEIENDKEPSELTLNRWSSDSSKPFKYKSKDQISIHKSFNGGEKLFRDALEKVESVHCKVYRNRLIDEPSIDNFLDEKHAEIDPEYKEFLQELKDGRINIPDKIREQNKDLFTMPEDYCLAHCVAEDLRMGSGIAVTFRNTFGNVDLLLKANEKTGGLVPLKVRSRLVYYLVTKKRSGDKPTYKDFWCSMKRLRDHTKKYGITKLAVPKLGCGLDQLNWTTVKHMIEFLFKNVRIEIVVCKFSPIEDPVLNNSIRIRRKNVNLNNAKESIIVYFTTADSYISDEMFELNERFPFLANFQKADKKFGGVVQSKVSDRILCGCVVRKTLADPFNYRSFSIALETVNGIVSDENCDTIALQYVEDVQDDLLHRKIVTVVLNYLKNVDVNVYLGDKNVLFGEM